MALFDTPRLGASGTSTGYQIQRSLRFDEGSDMYLARTPSSTGNQKVWTWSAWFKRNKLHDDGGTSYLFSSNNVSGNDGIAAIYMQNDEIYTYFDTSGSNPYGSVNGRKFRDTHAWYHIVWQVDAANTSQRIWVNGTELSLNSGNNPPNFNYGMNQSGIKMFVGRDGDWGSRYSNKYFAEVHYSDGNKYEASDFGETDSETGKWIPKSPSISYGTNGFYLNFSDNSDVTAATLGKDTSGNGNNFTPYNFSVSAGVNNDSFEDTPTNNFCVISRLDSWRSSTEVEDGSLKFRRHASNFGGARGSFAVKTGKWYFEFTKGSGLVQAGFVNSDFNINYNNGDVGLSGSGPFACGIAYDSRGVWYGYTGSSPSSIANDDIIGVAFDADNFKFYFHKNGTYYGSGNPSTGSNGIEPNHSNSISKQDHMTFAPYFNGENGNGYANFGQRPFSYSVPTGYKTLCDENFTPSIEKPEDYFDVLQWTGASTVNTRNITGLDFSPDWVWIKAKSHGSYGGGLSYHHMVWDIVRGPSTGSGAGQSGRDLAISGTFPESSNNTYSNYYGSISSFNSNGYTVRKHSGEPALYTDLNAREYVAWNWDAGSSTVTNNDGSVTSTIRASSISGFSICTWTGTGNNLTVGHGLGVKPMMYIVKARTGSSGCDWFVYQNFLTATHNLRFNQSTAGSSASDLFNNTEPTSSVFSIGNSSCINENGGTYVAYVFSDVPQFQKFGRYIGNGNSDGVFINCGFFPELVILKNTTNGHNWRMHDLTRQPENLGSSTDGHLLEPNNAIAETNEYDIDFVSNGFKLRVNRVYSNNNGSVFSYFAWAKNPFNNARAH